MCGSRPCARCYQRGCVPLAGDPLGLSALTARELEALRQAVRTAQSPDALRYLPFLDAATQVLVDRGIWDTTQRGSYLALPPDARIAAWASGEITRPLEDVVGAAAGEVRDPFGVGAFTAAEIEQLRRAVALARARGPQVIEELDRGAELLVRRGVWTPGHLDIYRGGSPAERAAAWASGEITRPIFEALDAATDVVDQAVPPVPSLPSLGGWVMAIGALLLLFMMFRRGDVRRAA